MSSSESSGTVVDDVAGHRFVLASDDGVSEMRYRLNGKRLVLLHTEVPERLRHHGIAGVLVRAALERAGAEALAVVPLCPYARKWLEDHPEAAETVTIDWGQRDRPA
jgi:uncharacterized protein